MKLIFLGPPGAGKGTQALGVSSRLNVPHISTGNMLRAAVRNETPMGLAAKKFMDAGQLVPDEVLIEMVRERLSMADCTNGYLLDGFPRTVEQAEALEGIASPDCVINIAVPDEQLLDRLTGRRVCGKCSGTFHISKLQMRAFARCAAGRSPTATTISPSPSASASRSTTSRPRPSSATTRARASSGPSTATARPRKCSRASSPPWSSAMITIKSAPQIEKMRAAGALARCAQRAPRRGPARHYHAGTGPHGRKLIRDAGAIPSFKGYEGFPSPSAHPWTTRSCTALPRKTASRRDRYSPSTAA